MRGGANAFLEPQNHISGDLPGIPKLVQNIESDRSKKKDMINETVLCRVTPNTSETF